MSKLTGLLFSAAVFGAAAAGVLSGGAFGREASRSEQLKPADSDTIIYPVSGYKLHRKGSFEEFILSDSLYAGMTFQLDEREDTLPKISARDTIKVPDSLRLTDPFRYRFYVALVDSLTHVEVRDSLRKSEAAHRDSSEFLLAKADSLDWRRLDSIYFADSTVRARAAFLAWYNGLSKTDRKKYDAERKATVKLHQMDSLRKIKEDRQAVRDSIIENTPRILETYFISDSMWYKRIINWTLDPDFHRMDVETIDTSFNYHYNDFAFQRKDVNATWLGVAGSPVQFYNYFNRTSESGLDFFTPLEAWTFSPRTLPHYNTKTPYTELGYSGTLLATDSKEESNVHLFTTQNILPELNFSLLYDRWGGEGILMNEASDNRVGVIDVNYTGKKYLGHAGLIHDRVVRGENGGICDDFWVRDTTVDAKEITVYNTNAVSQVVNNTVFLDQQLRIPFTFIEKLKARRDSTYTFNPDSLNRDITTAFIGHSSEYSSYSHRYEDKKAAINDTLAVDVLDNKFFIKLQPWFEDGAVSRLNVGLGDKLRIFTLPGGGKANENSVYLYAGVEGRIAKKIGWNAKGSYHLAGYDMGDFSVQADADYSFYPFRKAKTSPFKLAAHFETSLLEPNYYQKNMASSLYSWNKDFSKASTTKILGRISIPHWKADASVGYALLANNLYYDSTAQLAQNPDAMSILSASLRKDFKIGGLHLDNSALFQISSKPEVVPLPTLALKMRYYFEFVASRDQKTHTRTVLTMQIGANVLYNTPWFAPGFNPYLGVFYNQQDFKYSNGPVIDAFINMQWKKACIFVKFENVGMGWPNTRNRDYFSAAHYIVTTRGVKFGIFWPFYIQPGKGGHSHSHSTEGVSTGGLKQAM